MRRELMFCASALLLVVGGCRSEAQSEPSVHLGTLRASEYALAVKTAHQVQSQVTGTFVGATAIAAEHHRVPCDRDADCPDKRLVYIRLVWKMANFAHGGPGRLPGKKPSMAQTMKSPEGQALFIAVDPDTHDIVARAAGYGPVTPDAAETLLYGQRFE